MAAPVRREVAREGEALPKTIEAMAKAPDYSTRRSGFAERASGYFGRYVIEPLGALRDA